MVIHTYGGLMVSKTFRNYNIFHYFSEFLFSKVETILGFYVENNITYSKNVLI